MKRRKMTKRKKPEKEPTEALLLRPRVQFVEKLKAAANSAQRFITHNQVALEILERYLPLWEEIERDTEARVRAQHEQARGGGPQQMHLEGQPVEHGDLAGAQPRPDVTPVTPEPPEVPEAPETPAIPPGYIPGKRRKIKASPPAAKKRVNSK